jgi:hypothetical protein
MREWLKMMFDLPKHQLIYKFCAFFYYFAHA